MRLSSFALSALLALPLGLAAQTTPAQVQPGTTPVTSQTPAATNGTVMTAPDAATGAHLTKSERKAQHKQQKRDEKAATDNAKSAKANEKALKAQNKAVNASEKAQQPQ